MQLDHLPYLRLPAKAWLSAENWFKKWDMTKLGNDKRGSMN